MHKTSISQTNTSHRQSNLNSIRLCAELFSKNFRSLTFQEFATLLNQSWSYKLSNIPQTPTKTTLLAIYSQAIESGASCGKLLGAGGGGFFAFFVKPEKQVEFVKRMSPYIAIRAKVSKYGVQQII